MSAPQHKKRREQAGQPRKLDGRRSRLALVQGQRCKGALHRVCEVKTWVGNRQCEVQVEVSRRLDQHRMGAIRCSALIC